MKKVSFIILSWNSEDYLENNINSILRLKTVDIEIIIIDNGSKDRSVEIIESYNDERIVLIRLDKNYGTTVSRNVGLHRIRETNYICILDSDTIINDETIEKMMEVLDNDNSIGIVGPGMVNGKGEKQIPYRKFPTWKIKLLKAFPIKKIGQIGERLENYNVENLPDVFECDYLISACWLLRFETYRRLGDLDENIFYSPEDVEYCMRIRMNGMKIVHIKSVNITHFYQRISKKKFISKANYTHLLGIHYVLKKYKAFLKEYYKNNNV